LFYTDGLRTLSGSRDLRRADVILSTATECRKRPRLFDLFLRVSHVKMHGLRAEGRIQDGCDLHAKRYSAIRSDAFPTNRICANPPTIIAGGWQRRQSR
jgi:hypothetical protein